MSRPNIYAQHCEPVSWHKYTICANCHTDYPCATRKLADEALELLNAYRAVSGGGPLGTWRQAGGAQEYWLAVARKAREMRAEK